MPAHWAAALVRVLGGGAEQRDAVELYERPHDRLGEAQNSWMRGNSEHVAGWYEDRTQSFDILEFPEVNDRIGLIHHALGTDVTQHDHTQTWTTIEELTIPPGESRDLIRRYLAEGTAR